jgi:SnoaL-like domain
VWENVTESNGNEWNMIRIENNVGAIRRAIEAFAVGDAEVLKNTFAPDVYYHHVPLGIFSGNYKGRQAIMEFFCRIGHGIKARFVPCPWQSRQAAIACSC